MDSLGFSGRWQGVECKGGHGAAAGLRRNALRRAACMFAVCAAMCHAAAPDEDAQRAADMLSPACQRARATLEAALEASAKDRTQNAALDTARRAAAEACLGRADTSAPTVRGMPQGTVAAPPVRAYAPAALGAPSAGTVPPPPVEVLRPSVINSCDATGCWDNQGWRLQQVGPMLSGPRGACSVQGSFVSCP